MPAALENLPLVPDTSGEVGESKQLFPSHICVMRGTLKPESQRHQVPEPHWAFTGYT